MLLALLTALTGPALAAEDFGVTLGAGVGWIRVDDLENLESTWSAVPRLGYSLTRHLWFELESGVHQGSTRGFGYRYDSATPRVNLVVDLAPEAPVIPFVAGGPGFIWKRVSRSPDAWSAEPLEGEDLGNYKNPDSDLLVNLGPGLRVPLAGGMSLRGDLRWVYNLGTEPHGSVPDRFSDWELTVGATFRQADRNRDTDADGIIDREDACVNDPEDRDDYEDFDGCPDVDNDDDGLLDVRDDCRDDPEDFDGFEDRDGCPERDNDHDGLMDERDDCPDEPEDIDGYQDRDGCPDRDNDGDGLFDLDDRCPNDPEDIDGWMDEDGCRDPDDDGDAIADELDACPRQPEIYNDIADEDGCPESDRDGDGYVDEVDDCPDAPETFNGFDDQDGCPDEVPEEVERFTGVIRGINFEVDSDQITVDSYYILDEAAEVLMRYPHLRVEVQGHTDSDGSDTYNKELSHRRAASVVSYLILRGVEPENLTWIGYGEERPIVPNDSPAGKAVNRRVEFRRIEEGAPGTTPPAPAEDVQLEDGW